MVSKSQIKFITSLRQKKYRNKHSLFVVEGVKGIQEFLDASYGLHSLFTVAGYFEAVQENRYEIKEAGLQKISTLVTAQKALAIFKIPNPVPVSVKGLTLLLDDVRDPGNLGTIIRLCDWFDIKNLVCSLNTVDCYNPKVVQATMGSLARIAITYTDLASYLSAINKPIYGAYMQGENVYQTILDQDAVLVMGNEANGISDLLADHITNKLTIPQFGQSTTESLNVATATAILLNEFKRNEFTEK